jgi:hypothetical protein
MTIQDTVNAFIIFHPVRTNALILADACAALGFFAAAIWLHVTEDRT